MLQCFVFFESTAFVAFCEGYLSTQSLNFLTFLKLIVLFCCLNNCLFVLRLGYDSDEGGKGGRGASGGAKKALSVQDQMVRALSFFYICSVCFIEEYFSFCNAL